MPRKPRWAPSPEQLKQIEVLSGEGLSEEKIGTILGISKSTLERAWKKNVAVREALLRGRAIASHKVSQRAYQMATGGKYPAMTMFWLRCRDGWKDTSRVEHSGPDGKPLPAAITDGPATVIILPAKD